MHTHTQTHTHTAAGRPSPQMFPLRVISRICGVFWSVGPMTRSKAPEISVAGPEREFTLPAELHRDARLLPSMVSKRTEKWACVCVFVRRRTHEFVNACSTAVLWAFDLEDLYYVQIRFWQRASDTHVFCSVIGEPPHWPHLCLFFPP